MKLTLFAACLVAGIALSSCFVHSMPRHYAEKIEEIECPEEGDFWSPHPDCTKYYLCTNGRLFVLDCSGGLYWNQETKECAFPEEVPQCVGGTREPEGPTEVPTEQPSTEPPTEQPSTEPPTEQPTTEPPTEQPTTEPPTEQPTTEPPTQPPTTEPPTTQRPTEVTTDEPEVSTADPSNPCTDEGIYALPSAADCAEYTQCVNGIAIPSKCANGLLFDPLIGKCNKEELVQCFNPTTPSVTTTEEPVTTTSEAPVTEAPICEAEGVYNKPFPSNCSLFILCANGVPVIQECASGLSFDPEELICVREEDSSCVVETTTTAAPEVTTTEASQETTTFEPEVPTTVRPPVRCENDGVYNIPDPAGGDCSTYFLCINFVPYQQSCAAGTVFSPEAGQCVREENYECPSDSNPTTAAATTTEATTPEPTTPEATTTEATTTTEPTTPEPTTPAATTPVNEFPCPESTGLSYHPHPTSCRLFYSCRDSQFGAIFDCGVGLYFDSKTQACVFPESSDCPHKPKP